MVLVSTFMASWLTPSSLFLLLNLMIGTIFLTARLSTRRSPHQHHDHDSTHQLVRRRSSLLDRVMSINLSLYNFDPPPGSETDHPAQLARSPSLLQRLKSINFSTIRGSDPETEGEHEHQREHGVRRSKSEHARSDAHKEEAKAKAMTKSASERGAEIGGGRDDEEDEIAVERRRPATTRVAAEDVEEKMKKKKKSGECEGGEGTAAASLWDERGVDEKAEDFINRFKQQLRLQRLESLKRFSELLRGK